MARKPLNENFVIDFVQAVFNAIVNNRNQALQKAMEKDPKFQSIVDDIKKGHDDLIKWADEKAKTDPIFAKHWERSKAAGPV